MGGVWRCRIYFTDLDCGTTINLTIKPIAYARTHVTLWLIIEKRLTDELSNG